ncbi:GntP family permease [Nocardioides sp. NPDC101246]|uniref:GntP family permease n=1 Tax=Nocardioides sp. NPDC101246 TaxID=3364336 RepID=UPI003818ECFC
MSHDVLLITNTAVAIIGIVLAIVWLKFPPVFALLFGTLYLGLTTPVGAEGTIEAISGGFADVMADIGILVTFGVIIGALLTVTNTMERIVEAMLRVFGERSMPYVFAVALSTLFTSIYSDVLLVLSSPLARRIGPKLGPRGRALMGGSLTAGIEVGLVFVAPGVAALAIAGILDVPLGQMFVLGLIVGLPTAILTMLVFSVLLRFMKWDPELDELPDDVEGTEPETDDPISPAPETGGAGTRVATQIEVSPAPVRQLSLPASISPVLVALLLIAGGAAAQAANIDAPAVVLLTDPIVALFLGATLAYALACRVRERGEISSAIGTALTQCGPILVLSGISGSLGFVIEGSGMGEVLGEAFSAGFLPPLLLVWLVAAILHLALGSISVAGITAAGILAPIAGSLDTPVALIALAAGSGALFVPHVSSNFFWMFQSLLGFTTRGTVKTHSVPMTLASLISLPIILLLALFV